MEFGVIFRSQELKLETQTLTKNKLDERLIIEQSKKDPSKFSPIYDKYHEQIFRFVYSRVGHLEASKDITSSVFYKALAHIRKYKDQGLSFSSWLYRIAVNECYDYFRAQKKYRTVALEDYMHVDLLDEMQLDEDEKETWMNALPSLLERLDQKELELIELRFFESKSFREAGEILDITENNAKTRTYRILARIKKEVKNLS